MRKKREVEDPVHHFRDIGAPCDDPDFVPRLARNWWGRAVDPEAYLDKKFREIGFDYGGPITMRDAIDRLASVMVAAE